MTGGVLELAIVITVATVLGIIVHILKQPTFLAYIFAGVALSAFGIINSQNIGIFETFSSLGITFLLFLIGMEINYDSLRLVGKTSLILGLSQIFFTAFIGYFIALMFGFSTIASLYIAIALTFSSTIIIIKLLSERRQMHSLHGKISVGFLLVQDFVAMLILMVLAGLSEGDKITNISVALAVVKGVGLFIFMLYLGRKVIPPILDKVAQSLEMLFLTSLAWALGVAAAVSYLGFSIEIGGFLAGLALANSSEHFQISARIRSLRDFFILIFFVMLGLNFTFSEISGLAFPVIIFSLFVLIGNPLIVMALMGFMGYKKKTSFMSGITVAQISEFSLIVVALGLSVGHISGDIVSLVTAVGIVTIVTSTYIITYSEQIFSKLKSVLEVFEKKTAKDKVLDPGLKKPVVIIGAHRIGQNIASQLKKTETLIVDFDPEIINKLKEKGYNVLFGDISDEDIAEEAGIIEAKMIISTSPDFKTNESLISFIKNDTGTEDNTLTGHPLLVLRAETEKDAEYLYKKGADYVILPHLTAGQSLGRALLTGTHEDLLKELKERDLEQMQNSIVKT